MRAFRTATGTLAVLAGGLAALPAAAAADVEPPRVRAASVSTDAVTVPAVGAAKVRVRMRISDGHGVQGAYAVALPRSGPGTGGALVAVGPAVEAEAGDDLPELPVIPFAQLKLVAGTDRDGTWAGTLRVTRAAGAGPYVVSAWAVDGASNSASIASLGRVRARWQTAVRGVDAARTGSAVSVSGRLVHLTRAGWAGFGNRDVVVQFRPAGTVRWRVKGTVRTGADGRFDDARFRAYRTGAWRVTFAGGPLNAASASAAEVVALG